MQCVTPPDHFHHIEWYVDLTCAGCQAVFKVDADDVWKRLITSSDGPTHLGIKLKDGPNSYPYVLKKMSTLDSWCPICTTSLGTVDVPFGLRLRLVQQFCRKLSLPEPRLWEEGDSVP